MVSFKGEFICNPFVLILKKRQNRNRGERKIVRSLVIKERGVEGVVRREEKKEGIGEKGKKYEKGQ